MNQDNLISLIGDLAEQVRLLRMENTETQKAVKQLQREENNTPQTELPHVVPRAPVADLIFFPELSEANPLAEEDFFRNPLTEEERKGMLSTYFYMTFTVDVQNSPNSKFYVTASAYDNVSLDNAIWFGSATKSAQKAYIRQWTDHGKTPVVLSGIDPFSEGPKISPSPSNMYFILYDSTGLYFGVNGYITAQAINQAFVRKTLVFGNVYFTINSYNNDIATMNNIQYKCLSSDGCTNANYKKCAPKPTITVSQTQILTLTKSLECKTPAPITVYTTVKKYVTEFVENNKLQELPDDKEGYNNTNNDTKKTDKTSDSKTSDSKSEITKTSDAKSEITKTSDSKIKDVKIVCSKKQKDYLENKLIDTKCKNGFIITGKIQSKGDIYIALTDSEGFGGSNDYIDTTLAIKSNKNTIKNQSQSSYGQYYRRQYSEGYATNPSFKVEFKKNQCNIYMDNNLISKIKPTNKDISKFVFASQEKNCIITEIVVKAQVATKLLLLPASISMRLVGKLLGGELKLSSTRICKDPTVLCVKTTLATAKFLNAITLPHYLKLNSIISVLIIQTNAH
ncbi:hypothetical protein BB561_006481 [Smittium simulii]|uniref:Uncharacterized protein n=1 Tax=Smittium simulii TaxID=133385 RepID=A0A2T9Y3V0_9FUNG|nr:hypothetical protein BB561_006481 [Smittium simulii]